jgi:hypothetical protein
MTIDPFEAVPLWVALVAGLLLSKMVAVKLDCVIPAGIVGVTEEIKMVPDVLQVTLIEPGLSEKAVSNVLAARLYPNVPGLLNVSSNKQVAGTFSEIVIIAVSAEAFEATPRELTKVNVARAKERRKFLSMDLVDKD